MSNLAINPDNETWNSWINFNLNRFQDRMYYEEQKLENIKSLIKTRPSIK